MRYQLNQRSLEDLKALIRAGKYVDKPWSFTAKDSNALLGDPPNWTSYSRWFLGIDGSAPKGTKARFAFPYGKNGVAYVSALRAIASRAAANGDGQIAQAASELLDEIHQKEADKATAAGCEFDIRGAATITAATAAEEGKGEAGLPTFSMTAYTGGPLTLANWKYPIVVDLAGVEAPTKARPALKDHDPAKPVGHMPLGGIKVTTGRQGKITAEGVISGHGEHVDQVVESGKKHFPWQSSIGAKVKQAQFIPKGRAVEVNGRQFSGPIFVARRTALGEISFVSLGADDNTSARIAAHAAKDSVMTFEQWLEAMGLKLADLSEDQKSKLQAKFDKEIADIQAAGKGASCDDGDDEADASADDEDEDDNEDEDSDDDDEEDDEEPKKKAPAKGKAKMKARGGKAKASGAPLDLKAVRASAVKELRAAHVAETKRIGHVRKICAGRHAEIEAKAIEEGWTDTQTELEVLRAERKSTRGESGNGSITAASFGINTGKGVEITPDVIAAAASISAGVGEKAAVKDLSEQQANVAVSRKVRSSVGSMFGLCSLIASVHGVRLPSSRMDDDVIRAMFRLDRRVQEMDIQADGGTGGYSSMSLSGVTENILNKAMLEAYGNIASVVGDIAYETDTSDFKQFKRYRLTSSGILAALGAAGELKSISLQDESYANQVKTQGVILTIGRDILLNDDMGALTQGPTLLGRGAGLYREMMVFGTLLTGTSTTAPGASVGQTANGFNFFSTGAKNYLSGGTSSLQISSLTSAVQKFREQVDANGMPIMLNPDRLLLPPALEVTGKNLFNGAELVVTALTSTTASSKSVDPNVNAHKGAYRPIVSPFLSATVGTALAKLNKSDPNFANFSSASDTAWYLLPNPSGGFAPVQVGYLRGQRTPIIERGEANFNTLGIAMRCYYDFGTALHDYRCAVMSAGA